MRPSRAADSGDARTISCRAPITDNSLGLEPLTWTERAGRAAASGPSRQAKLVPARFEQLAQLEVELLVELVQHPLAELRVAPLGFAPPPEPQRQLDVSALQVHVVGLELDQAPE